MLSQQSKHVDLTVHRRTTQNSQTGPDESRRIYPMHLPAFLCVMCQCVCVCASWFIMQFVIRCCSLSVVSLGVSGCLWVPDCLEVSDKGSKHAMATKATDTTITQVSES